MVAQLVIERLARPFQRALARRLETPFECALAPPVAAWLGAVLAQASTLARRARQLELTRLGEYLGGSF